MTIEVTRERSQDGQELGLSDYRIRDIQSFEEVTGEPRQVAGLYSFLLLDCLVDLAYKVSLDFFKRPQLYTDLGQSEDGRNNVVPVLAKLHARYGSDERVPSKAQRDEIYVPIFGPSGAYLPNDSANNSDFSRLRNELVQATTAFSEHATAFSDHAFTSGVPMLRESVRAAHGPFKGLLEGLQGDSVRWAKDEALSELTERIAYPILRNKGVAAVFGISKTPKAEWPFAEDSNGDKLVEGISKALGPDEQGKSISRERFVNLQRVALRGAEAIATIMDFREEDASDHDLDVLITKVYTWGTSLLSLQRP